MKSLAVRILIAGISVAAVSTLALGCERHGAAKTGTKTTEMQAAQGHEGHDHAQGGHDHGAVSPEQTKQMAAQTSCPVMGNAIDRNLYVDFDGKRIYVCCKGCIDPIKKDPAKYLKKLEEMGQAAETVPET